MKINRIFLKSNSKFSTSIATWANTKADEVFSINEKNTLASSIEGLLIFSQSQYLNSEILEMKAAFDKLQKPIHGIDIDGTLTVGVSNLGLWLEHNRCKSILILGADELSQNINLERFLNNI